MLANCLSQDLFMKTHQSKTNENLDQIEEHRVPVTVTALNGNFKIRFDPQCDIYNDFTVGAKRVINNAMVQKMYKKGIDNVFSV
jgi:hypothetical protein